MNRIEILERLAREKQWDCVVVGGGATGLGVAVDAAARGYRVAILEVADFAKGTSSKSTKLVHGGVRYLQHGDVMLVLEALRERGRMKRNAPHLVKDQSFVISNYSWWDNILYLCGLTFYDLLSFGFGYGRSRFISAKKVMDYLPHIARRGLKGGVVYHDGQFDDARMAVNLAQTCVEHGGAALNRAQVTAITHGSDGRVDGVRFKDLETGREYGLKAKCVVNACGVFVDSIMGMDAPEHKPMVVPSQGVHLVFDKKFLPGDYAMMVPRTSDGRVLFAVPWRDKVVVGTTDIPRPTPELEPLPLKEEVDFILNTAARYFETPPRYEDIESVFAGQRPLAAPKSEGKQTKELSRGHKIIVSEHKLITITGGKWTSYRRMAEDAVDRAIALGLLEPRKRRTRNLRVHGYRPAPDLADHMYVYGSDEPLVRALAASGPEMAQPIHEHYPFTAAEVVWAVREEMARDVEDVLARRVRLLFMDAAAAVEAAPKVAGIIAAELGRDKEWERRQVETFTAYAGNYMAGIADVTAVPFCDAVASKTGTHTPTGATAPAAKTATTVAQTTAETAAQTPAGATAQTEAQNIVAHAKLSTTASGQRAAAGK
ncbi:MAG: glycerol-3-phosphate dehydrogenase/oxidase [Rikenellaceae bacterium]|nr:glycerol-3-phosphate dehydrogenase/oxidase [Rikenellaceae bacterium]